MSRRQISRRIRARLHGERGFTILEMMIAMVVVFASLTALMYTATSGFRYIALGRERQSATGVATRLMEQIHALSVDTITKGMKTSDLAGDPKIKTPTDCGDGAYHFESCSGEKIVHTATAANVVPLVPHLGTLTAPEYPTTYSWASYVTNNDTANDPYRVTVIVSWTEGGVAGAARFIQVQTLWSSPKGCAASGIIHPFAGPCQPYFTGSASAPQGSIVLSGTVNGTAVTGASLLGAQVDTRASAEQVSQLTSTLSQSGATWSTFTRGLATYTGAADGNPTTGTGTYDPSVGVPPSTLTPTYGSAIAVTAAPVALSLSAGASGDSGSTVSADATNSGTAKCPSAASPWPASQSDSLPCSWGRVVRGATMTDIVNTTSILGGTTATAGSTTIASLTGTGTLDAWADRQVSGGTTGSLSMTAKRTIGTLELFGIPAKFLAANTATDTNTASTITAIAALQVCTGGNYLLRSTSGTATASTTTGLSAANPSASWSGASVKFYDGYTGDGSLACDSYADAQVNTTSGQAPTFPCIGASSPCTAASPIELVRAVRVSGSNWSCIRYRVSMPSSISTAPHFGGVTTTKLPSSGTTLTDATATMNPLVQGDFLVQLIYETNNNSSCTSGSAVQTSQFSLTATVSVGSITSRAQYIAPPTGG